MTRDKGVGKHQISDFRVRWSVVVPQVRSQFSVPMVRSSSLEMGTFYIRILFSLRNYYHPLKLTYPRRMKPPQESGPVIDLYQRTRQDKPKPLSPRKMKKTPRPQRERLAETGMLGWGERGGVPPRRGPIRHLCLGQIIAPYKVLYTSPSAAAWLEVVRSSRVRST